MSDSTAKPSFEYVSQLVVLEEPAPTYEALCRWQKRFPDYHDLLADFFANWTTQAKQSRQAAVIDEVALVKNGVSSNEPLPLFDQIVLASVFVLRGAGYVVNINQKVREMYGRDVPLASTVGSLLRLEQRKLVGWRYADAEKDPEKEGTQYFALTPTGDHVLAHMRATSSLVADFLA
jgi:hypothetical protein